MVANQPAVWVVRGGNNNELASQVRTKHAVAVGWMPQRDVVDLSSRDQFRATMEAADPGSAKPDAVGQLYRFATKIQLGDYVLTPEKVNSEIHISKCTGAYKFDSSVFGPDYPHVRPVEYLKSVPRKYFNQTVRNTLGSVLTVFRADIALPYIESYLGLAPAVAEGDVEGVVEAGVWADDIAGQAKGQILEALDNIEHHDFQTFVAGLLAALGYKTRVGKRGADGGVDVLAFPDTFGLESPRIKVQVKNQKSSAGVQDVGYLNGVLANSERGLFVCTGGFTKDAETAQSVASGNVVLVDGNRLLDLILEHYEQLPDDAKAMLPLRKVYVPEKPVA